MFFGLLRPSSSGLKSSKITISYKVRVRNISSSMTQNNILIYLLRRDLRLEDNPVFDTIAKAVATQKYTHVLPVYVFAAQQIEVSGFIKSGSSSRSPYPEARSPVGNFWRCGPHRAKFLSESVWDLKTNLQKIGSDLDIRVGMVPEVVEHLVKNISQSGDSKIGGVWMTAEEGAEEKKEEREVSQICRNHNAEFKLFVDEKYFIDDRDVPYEHPKDFPDVFTTYRKQVEPLRRAPRRMLSTPRRLPSLPDPASVPSQHGPFTIPSTLEDLQSALMRSLSLDSLLKNAPPAPRNTPSAHPFAGGASTGLQRIVDLMSNGSMTAYKATRNGLLGTDFSTKLSAWLALGCVTSRQIHHSLLDFENGSLSVRPTAGSAGNSWDDVPGYGKGENDGTKAVRFELLWRDYMRLCTRKFGSKLFKVGGFRGDNKMTWRYKDQDRATNDTLERFLNGTTGMGLIDASQRELFLTGYTSNRARQNVASFLAKHLSVDWRLGAEWYESMLVDYDVSSNWGNWQYVAGVGNDPRGEERVFNPVKQAWDYDSQGKYVLGWVTELADANNKKDIPDLLVNEIFQAWEIPAEKKQELQLDGLIWVTKPLKQISFTVGNSAFKNKRGGRGGGGGGGGGYRGGSQKTGGEKGMGRGGGQSRGGYANARYGTGGGQGGYNGRGYGGSGSGRGGRQGGRDGSSFHGGGRQARSGMMEKVEQMEQHNSQDQSQS